jgi:hypothetical protein
VRISVRQSGGFAGLGERIGPVDTSALPRDEAAEIESELQRLGFFSLPSADASIGADLVRYEMTVADDGREHTVQFSDDGSDRSARLLDLIDRLRSS